MVRYFTYGWRHREMRRHGAGEPIGIAYGSQFARRGVRPNDEIYIVSVHRGRVYLLGKMQAGVVGYCADTFLQWVGTDPPPALEHVIAYACTPAGPIRLPDEVVERLRFRRGKEFVGLSLRDGELTERQSLR